MKVIFTKQPYLEFYMGSVDTLKFNQSFLLLNLRRAWNKANFYTLLAEWTGLDPC